MSMFRHGCLLFAFVSVSAISQEPPGLGEPVDPDRIAEIDYTIMPNGDGLPPGSGSAREGRDVFNRHCIACHGQEGQGALNDRLVGGHGTLGTDMPVKTVGSYWPYATTVFDYVRRAMPLQSPGILSDDELYAVTAYVLYMNDIVDEDQSLTMDNLAAVEMPNRDGFTWDYLP